MNKPLKPCWCGAPTRRKKNGIVVCCNPVVELIRELRDALQDEHQNWVMMIGGRHRCAEDACHTYSLISRADANLREHGGEK